jgi:hypothetical protein
LICLFQIWLLTAYLEPYKVEDIGARFLVSLARNEDKLLFQIRRDGIPPITEMFLFDPNTETFLKIEDGRLGKRSFQIVPHQKGFLLYAKSFSSTPKFFLLDPNGQFVKSLHIDLIANLEPQDAITQVSPALDGGIFLTIERLEDVENRILILALLDFERKEVHPITSRKLAEKDNQAYWISNGRNIFFIRSFSREIEVINPQTFETKTTLLEAQDLIPAKKQQRISKKSNPSFLDYLPRLQSPLFDGERLIIRGTDYLEGTEEVSFLGFKTRVRQSENRFVELQLDSVVDTTNLTLTFSNGKNLVFLPEEGGFELK